MSIKMKLFTIAILCGVFCASEVSCLKLINGNHTLNLDILSNGARLSLLLDNIERISGLIGEGKNLANLTCEDGSPNCSFEGDDFVLNISGLDNGFNISWESYNIQTKFQDCVDLNKDKINWFGGPERWNAQWPIEDLIISNHPYRISKEQNGAVAERYWLNSRGAYVFVDDRVPLFVDQNVLKKETICFSAKIAEPYTRRTRVLLQYVLVALPNAKEAQLHAVSNYLGKPSGSPNVRMIKFPIWTTWAKYKKNINDSIVLEFAQDIYNRNFTGQVEIDDYWETCYGSMTFSNQTFSNIGNTVKSLKEMGFTVTLWTHPFVNDDCEEPKKIGRENNYFIKSELGNDNMVWWDGAGHHIDFTKKEAREWFVSRLRLIQKNYQIDNFKFDAGENDWPPQVPVLNEDIELSPNILTKYYVETCALFGDLIELRSAWRTQHLPIFVRMCDKDSRWGLNNGLHNLITTLLQMNINGYTFVLPDMIGGNGYGNDVLTAELLVRWTQANAFMPSMQFSYLPWEITSDQYDVVAIVRKFVDLHEQFAEEIQKAINASVFEGTPVNPPIWWVDPTNSNAHKVNDEYLLGESILVAPVIQEGATSRDVVLPLGSWKDGNDGKIYEGPQIIKNYPAPIDILPYFIKQ